MSEDHEHRTNSLEPPVHRSTLPPATSSIPTSRRNNESVSTVRAEAGTPRRWTFGILEDQKTDEVPGTVLLLSKYSTKNIPLGLQHEIRGRSLSQGSISAEATRRRSCSESSHVPVKKTKDGQVILDPQPDDSVNDPLNWPALRRDIALLSLGFYCMVGGGMTPILAAGFNNVAVTFNVQFADVARTTGYYMLGMGIGSVFFSPTAILYGKRPIYLLSSLLFIGTSIWCAASPNYANLAVARFFQGVSVSPVECLPSATIAEIFFLHERAFRIGIYTLLLLGGKNLVPLVSAVIIQALDWRWVFWIVAAVVAFCALLLFLFVPETFWDRTPRPRGLRARSASARSRQLQRRTDTGADGKTVSIDSSVSSKHHGIPGTISVPVAEQKPVGHMGLDGKARPMLLDLSAMPKPDSIDVPLVPIHAVHFENDPTLPALHNLNSPYYVELERNRDYMDFHQGWTKELPQHETSPSPARPPTVTQPKPESVPATQDLEHPALIPALARSSTGLSYTGNLRHNAARGWSASLRPFNGRLSKVSWLRTMARPFLLYAYPSVLWSALIYSLSVGWLIVLSESVSHIFINRETYNFTSLQVGLVYMSPFIGGILGTAVAGKLSDKVVRFMARRNDGIYEPEYRLVMAVPILISTVTGLMGFGWSAEERDAWIVPTIFFGVISFGCSLGSTTAITFCVDSYRQYAGEALVTLNFSKNVLHGLVWSLFFPQWLTADGPKTVFVAIGGIQIVCLLTTIPMYIFGKRARMWTVRKGMMDKF